MAAAAAAGTPKYPDTIIANKSTDIERLANEYVTAVDKWLTDRKMKTIDDMDNACLAHCRALGNDVIQKQDMRNKTIRALINMLSTGSGELEAARRFGKSSLLMGLASVLGSYGYRVIVYKPWRSSRIYAEENVEKLDVKPVPFVVDHLPQRTWRAFDKAHPEYASTAKNVIVLSEEIWRPPVPEAWKNFHVGSPMEY